MLFRELLSLGGRRGIVETIEPKRTFSDVVLPAATRQALEEALTQIRKHRLIFRQWGLGERHPTAAGLAFHFAGPPGTGKTICAEALAGALDKPLLRVQYSELESCWVGESGKNVASAFRQAREQDAVLFFDEADSIASRRFAGTASGYEREANQTVNILLKELENAPGVVVFATNLASNFDPAFERRIRTHVLFEMPDAAQREKIWEAQVHPGKTPLAADVNFRALAQMHELSGGDIQNAVLKDAQIAAGEEGRDREKTIGQRHLQAAVERVMHGRTVMRQSLFGGATAGLPDWLASAGRQEERLDDAEREIGLLRSEIDRLRTELEESALAQSRDWEARLARVTVLPIPRWVSIALSLLALAGSGWAGAVFFGLP